jgi:poly(3-hydroxybutyrate) depolymerase
MKKTFHVLVGATASLTALLLACSAAQPDNAGTGPVTQTGTGGSTGGTPASGGASMGGASVGGASTGGASTGGVPAKATGGAATAGSSSGGSSGGGASKGGTANVGGANGGAASGGSGNGGAGNGGVVGQAGSAGAAGGAATSKRSMGCDKTTTQTENQWVESMVMTGGANRPYSVRLPSDYDASRAYPVVVLLHGCSGGTNNVPIEKASGSDAILVRGTGSASGTCWDASANGKDVPFFDSMVADTKARFCADESRVFIVGYSSGSWLVNQLTCIRADVVRGGASVSGGESSSGKCGVPVARIFLHDSSDNDNQISGSERARARQLTQNMCDESAAPTDVDPSPCKAYQGCKDGYPVHWCQTSGKGHDRQDSFAPSAFWNFFKAL